MVRVLSLILLLAGSAVMAQTTETLPLNADTTTAVRVATDDTETTAGQTAAPEPEKASEPVEAVDGAETTSSSAATTEAAEAGVANDASPTTASAAEKESQPEIAVFAPGGDEIPVSNSTTVTLEGGLQYQVLREGTGAQADTTSTRRIHYMLWLTDGKLLESSRKHILPRPFDFIPGTNQAVVGMEQGTDTMRVGEVRLIRMPAALAYGNKEHGNVPPNSNLVFEVELVDLLDPNRNGAQEHLEP